MDLMGERWYWRHSASLGGRCDWYLGFLTERSLRALIPWADDLDTSKPAKWSSWH